jgi:alpha-glucosidase
MGTWGPGPFDSDTAEDYLDELEDRPASGRLEVITTTFRTTSEGGISSEVLPEEVMAAAAVVAANLPAGASLEWSEDYSDVINWLPKPINSSLTSSAMQALENVFSENESFWRSWVNEEEREEARAELDRVKALLRSADVDESR